MLEYIDKRESLNSQTWFGYVLFK